MGAIKLGKYILFYKKPFERDIYQISKTKCRARPNKNTANREKFDCWA